jgi:hypothetical protein
MCADDGKTTMNFFLALLLGCVTCNIYLFVWMYKVWDRVDQKAQRLGGVEGVNSAIVSLLIGFVPVYSFYYVCETMNKLARRTGTLVSA